MRYLKIHSFESGQWHDRDEWLLHAAFQILVDFVEQKKPAKIIDWRYDEVHQQEIRSEIESLYRWWTVERPQRPDPMEGVDFPDSLLGIFDNRNDYPELFAAIDESNRMDDEWHQEEQANLHRLIEIRPFLWT